MGGSESKEEEKDWFEFTQNQNYRQNINNTYANPNTVDYQAGHQPQQQQRWASQLNGDNIDKEKKAINQVKLAFNLIEIDMKVVDDSSGNNFMKLQLPLYIAPGNTVTIYAIMCASMGDFKTKGVLEAFIPKKGPQGSSSIQAMGSFNPEETRKTVEIPLNFQPYSVSELTEYKGNNIPLTLYLVSNNPNSPVSEMLYLCYFDKRNA